MDECGFPFDSLWNTRLWQATNMRHSKKTFQNELSCIQTFPLFNFMCNQNHTKYNPCSMEYCSETTLILLSTITSFSIYFIVLSESGFYSSEKPQKRHILNFWMSKLHIFIHARIDSINRIRCNWKRRKVKVNIIYIHRIPLNISLLVLMLFGQATKCHFARVTSIMEFMFFHIYFS